VDRRIWASRVGVDRQDVAGGDLPIDMDGIGVEQLQVGEKANSVVRRELIGIGRSRSRW
jgi:hypothetical protein